MFSGSAAYCAQTNILQDLSLESNAVREEFQKQAQEYRQEGIKQQSAGNLQEAIALYQKAIGLDPTNAQAYNDLGVVFESLGMIERAKETYKTAAAVDPTYPNSYSNLALLYESEQDYTSAILCWIKRAMVGAPDDPWTSVAIKRLEQVNRINPDAFSKIDKAYVQGLYSMDIYPGMEYQNPSKVTLLDPQTDSSRVRNVDPKIEALRYVQQAKEKMAIGEYATALKSVTIAEYLDPANSDIKALAERIREALLK
ncbi:MAG: tetratricopeptide repeat protein [Candidatus Omnitrophica bacterium]|nr:tetratricopeptide repeat protein [Candidatus Omnitrophota bacterium]